MFSFFKSLVGWDEDNELGSEANEDNELGSVANNDNDVSKETESNRSDEAESEEYRRDSKKVVKVETDTQSDETSDSGTNTNNAERRHGPPPMMSQHQLLGGLDQEAVPIPWNYFSGGLFGNTQLTLLTPDLVKRYLTTDRHGFLITKEKANGLLELELKESEENGYSSRREALILQKKHQLINRETGGVVSAGPCGFVDHFQIRADQIAVTDTNVGSINTLLYNNDYGMAMVPKDSVQAGILGGNSKMIVAVGPPTDYGQPGHLAAIYREGTFTKFPAPGRAFGYNPDPMADWRDDCRAAAEDSDSQSSDDLGGWKPKKKRPAYILLDGYSDISSDSSVEFSTDSSEEEDSSESSSEFSDDESLSHKSNFWDSLQFYVNKTYSLLKPWIEAILRY